jgi:hypothetical protein
VHESVRLTICYGVHLVKDFAIFNIFVVYTPFIMADSGNNIVGFFFVSVRLGT